MRSYVWPLLVAAFMAGADGQYLTKAERKLKVNSLDCFHTYNESIYEYEFETIDGQRNVSLGDYRNHTLLILNALKQQFSNKLFEIIAFPCNQFGMQEPGGSGAEILNGIKYVRPGNGFEPNFLFSKKIDVNGDKEHPIYSYLKRSCPSTQTEFSGRDRLFYDKLHVRDVRWNWEKFLIHPTSGQPIRRYDASLEPHNIATDIAKIALNRTTTGPINNAIQTRL
ncbi:unnamed protein product, partial [Medioppia subpectinata]